MYELLEEKHLLPAKQKGWTRKSRGTKDQLLVDKLIIKNCKRRKTGLGMAWIDYKKVFGLVPPSWILQCKRMFGIAQNMVGLIQNSIKQRRTVLTAGSEALLAKLISEEEYFSETASHLSFFLSHSSP